MGNMPAPRWHSRNSRTAPFCSLGQYTLEKGRRDSFDPDPLYGWGNEAQRTDSENRVLPKLSGSPELEFFLSISRQAPQSFMLTMCLVYQVQWWIEPLASFPALVRLSKLKQSQNHSGATELDAFPVDKVLITHDRLHLMTWTSQLWDSVDIYVSGVQMVHLDPTAARDLKMCRTHMVLCVAWGNNRQKCRHAELRGCAWFLPTSIFTFSIPRWFCFSW